jgi:hypothetical protein
MEQQITYTCIDLLLPWSPVCIEIEHICYLLCSQWHFFVHGKSRARWFPRRTDVNECHRPQLYINETNRSQFVINNSLLGVVVGRLLPGYIVTNAPIGPPQYHLKYQHEFLFVYLFSSWIRLIYIAYMTLNNKYPTKLLP